ncbi:MAG TPA: hypothetical protein VMH87_09670 [Pseudomonadales bacterium]|nr:hypothetical protein [Pseudomonadales bacterium]
MNSRYEEWLKHVFDHVVTEKLPEWYWDESAPTFEASQSEITELLSETFLRAGKDLIKYTDAQLNQGIWYVVSPPCSDFIHALKSPEVPLAKRLEAIGNIFNLYSDCFAKRCAETLGHLSGEGSPLNLCCYMFWDISYLDYAKDIPDGKQMEEAALNVLQKILTIEHRACREGALHGLSGYALAGNKKAHQIIDQFLSNTKLDDQLLAYARNAREGNVL